VILYTIAMLSLGALIGGYFYKNKFKKEAAKSLDATYHKGFESGMEKAKADMDTSFETYFRDEMEKAIKDLDDMRHKATESGMKKAKDDMDTSFEAYLRAQIEEEKAKIDKIAEEIEREIKMEENDFCCGSGCGHCDDYSVALSKKKPKKKSTPKKKKATSKGGSKK